MDSITSLSANAPPTPLEKAIFIPSRLVSEKFVNVGFSSPIVPFSPSDEILT